MTVLSNAVIHAYAMLCRENRIATSDIPERYRDSVNKVLTESGEEQ